MRLLALAFVGAVLAGCGQTPSPTATQTPTPPVNPSTATIATGTPTPSALVPTPSPSPNPEVVRAAAAKAYLSAANLANKAQAANLKKYPTFGTLAKSRAYYKADEKIVGKFIAAIKAITFPADMAGDVHTLISREAAFQALDAEGAAAKTWTQVYSVDASEKTAGRAATAAANLIRVDLGLPPVKF